MFLLRKQATHQLPQYGRFYICSLSTETIVYKVISFIILCAKHVIFSWILDWQHLVVLIDKPVMVCEEKVGKCEREKIETPISPVLIGWLPTR